MAAPETHPLEHIVTIRRLLEHYEQGFAFIKELVQNADDALKESLQPGRLHLQWYNPTADAGFENPLLRGPALIVINNGPFTIRDRNGLMRMGMGSKAGDSDRIGRFGLGMKAVFHVSEAFFFLESEGEQELRELFCPWLPPQYESWAIVDDHQDWSRITNAVKEMAPDFSKWFAVWIPLRRKELVTNDNPIVNAHPGDSETCPGSLIQAFNHQTPSLGEVLIFLRNLERVSFHDGMALHEFIHRRDEKRVSPQTKYYRHDTAENAVLVEGWKTKPAWPKVFEITDTGERSVPDKAKWEASVAISVSKPTGGGSVRLFWNVFLPVGNKPAFEAKLPSLGWNLNVFLHGYFFLSEDRTTVYGADDGFQSASDGDPKGIKIAWNKALATSPNGLLPLIPSALQSAFSGENFSDVQIQEVIACLTGSGWFKIYRKYICQTHSFARLLTNETWAWQHFDSGTARLVFPNFTDLNNESIVSSLLGSSSLDRVVLLENSAALSAGDLKLNWTESDLKWFCESIRQETLKKDAPARKYVTKLLSRLEQIVTSNSQIWHKLPIYEVASINGTSSVVSAKSLQDHASKNVLFSNIEAGLKKSFKDACPNASAWFVVGSAPPGISAQAFDTCAVAAMVLLQASLGGAKNRTDLIGKLLADLEKPKAKSAIRYLIHGNADNRKTDGNLLLRLSGNDGVSKWNTVIETALKQRTETWRLVDATFAIWINDQQKISLNLKMCGADSFRTLCNATDSEVAELPLAPFHDFLVTHLNEGTHYDADADNKLLRRLKIHRYGEDSFTTIEESVWLAPEVGKEPPKELRQDWSRLCQNAKIVSRIQDDTVGLRQRQLFKDRILDSNGIIRLACQQAEPHHFASLILHYLNAGTPTAETSETLKKASWLPLADDKATTLENLLWLE
ncbi:MAG: hypothetical protein NTV80_10640, partial [Verrucomicrobia bacterium]|nr:hypothetical protein [Verrucomicrobiota bacterium]